MLGWMCGIKLHSKDKIENERTGGTMKVGEKSKKLPERRLRCCRHVLRRDEEYVGKDLNNTMSSNCHFQYNRNQNY